MRALDHERFCGLAEPPNFGAATSPLIYDGLVIIHAGGNKQGQLVARDIDSGEVRWSLEDSGNSYAAPVLAELDGVRQILAKTPEELVGLEPATGKQFWSYPCANPSKKPILTPVVYGNTVLLSDNKMGLRALEVNLDGEWKQSVLWTSDEASMWMSNPVIVGDRIFGFSQTEKGQYVCVDADDGSLLWASEGRQGENASFLADAGHVFPVGDDAGLRILKHDAPLSRTRPYHTTPTRSGRNPSPVKAGSRSSPRPA